MDIDRMHLIGLLEKEVERRTEECRAKAAAKLETEESQRLAMAERDRELWQDFCATALTRYNERQPIRLEDFPESLLDRYGKPILWQSSSTDREAELEVAIARRTDDLQALLNFLRSGFSDNVTASEIARLGFRLPVVFGR